MHISNDSVLQKIQQALYQAQNSQSLSEAATHLANIKVLSELWLEEYKKQEGQLPLKVLAETKGDTPQSVEYPPMDSSSEQPADKKDDGFSIFDF